MKKYLVYTAVLFFVACNSNDEQSSDKAKEMESTQKDNSESGTGLLSGKFEIIDYKKDNVKIDLPKTVVEFTKNGDVIKPDGVRYFYKIEGDSILFLSAPGKVAYKSKIEFLNSDMTTFVVKTPLDKTEMTYKKQ